jgi:hypothetical protein
MLILYSLLFFVALFFVQYYFKLKKFIKSKDFRFEKHHENPNFIEGELHFWILRVYFKG